MAVLKRGRAGCAHGPRGELVGRKRSEEEGAELSMGTACVPEVPPTAYLTQCTPAHNDYISFHNEEDLLNDIFAFRNSWQWISHLIYNSV